MSNHRVDTAVVLAGGLGTRLRSVVPDLPKPMASVAGRPFLERLFDYWIRQGIMCFVVSVGYRHEGITGHFGALYRGAEIRYVVEEQPLGTGGGLLLASTELSHEEPFLLLNGDTYFAVGLEELQAFFRAHDADWCFSLFTTSVQGRYMGMGVAQSGRIVSLGEDSLESETHVNGGVYLVHPRTLSNFLASGYAHGTKVSLEDDILPAALSSGQRMYGMPSSGVFIDIGVPEDYERAQTLLTTSP